MTRRQAALEKYFWAVTAFFVTVEPIALTPLFLALTKDEIPAERRRIAIRTAVIAAAVPLVASRVFLLLGIAGANAVSRVLGIVLAALAVQFFLDGLMETGVIRPAA